MIYIDTFEPDIILNGLAQTTEVLRVPLNVGDRADYFWLVEHDNHAVQIERKQTGEVLSDFGGVEEALLRYMPNSDEIALLIEGVVAPTQYGCDTYIQSIDKPYFRLSHRFGKVVKPQTGIYSKYQAWKWSLDKQGISVYETHSVQGTVRAIAAFFHNSQKEEHKILNRYIRPKPAVISPNHHVRALMGISLAYGLNIGEDRAKALVAVFGHLDNILRADIDTLATVEGIGKHIAKKLKEGISLQ